MVLRGYKRSSGNNSMWKIFLECFKHWGRSSVNRSAPSQNVCWYEWRVCCWALDRDVQSRWSKYENEPSEKLVHRGPFSFRITERHRAVCFICYTLNPINPPCYNFLWENLRVMSRKWELNSGYLMQKEMKKVIYTNSGELRETFSSFQEVHPQKQLQI